MMQVYCSVNMADFAAEEIGYTEGVPPTMDFWRVSGISGLAGDPGFKILKTEILEAKYSF
jgi:hypothetical protein